ncbi:hypothetical protein DRV84_14830 [Rhodosalinus sediminis]|uniref:LacI family transcriptional regulator n=1 Tax=Rhodosalinus sediminis TaxID=1940533 RepID=A0A3D9BJU2_9RHOB|nr:hypothetical protein [Rhodosalinus sediminis]REC53672.1 hypothetical protein DRV84_14830 [Rhodosalinus sediminis]
MTRGRPIPDTVTLNVPFRLVKRGGRKEMQMPEGAAQARRTDSTLVKALARAFRWKRMLESGEFTSISELAEREGIAFTYMARLMRLSLLAPDIVDAIMDGRQPATVTLAKLIDPFPLDWTEQRALWLAEHTLD